MKIYTIFNLNNNIFILLFVVYIFICLIALIYYYIKENYITYENNIKSKKTDENIFYIFWNGDCRSTYRLLEMLIIECKHVKPLYFKALNNSLKKRKFELNIMNIITKKIKKYNPYFNELLHSIEIIDDDINDKEFNNYYKQIYSEYKLDKLFKYSINKNNNAYNKFYIIGKYSLYYNIYIDICLNSYDNVEKKLINKIKSNLMEISQIRKNINNKKINTLNYQLKNNININNEHPYKYLRFPLFYKKNFKEICETHNIKNILDLSWECQNINYKSGKYCGDCSKCLMIKNI